jgi:hypothetical protein
MQNTIGFSPTVDALLNDAGNFYKSSLYQSAYNKISDAYAAIGNF